MKKGIDISSNQGVINFSKVKNEGGIEFVILRDGYGHNLPADSKFFQYVKGCKEVGLPIIGVYHFMYSRTIDHAIQEANDAVRNVQKAGLGKDIYIAADFEYDTVETAARYGVTLTKEDCNQHVLAFCNQIMNLGYKPLVYTNLDYYKNWYTDVIRKKFPIWLADYYGAPDFDCTIQQYTSVGKVPGISGNVDVNYYFDNSGTKPADQQGKKTIDEIAQEVIDGLWGNGAYRNLLLTQNGYNYPSIQKRVNEILNDPAKFVPANPVENKLSEKIAKDPAKGFDVLIAGSYTATDDVYCRSGAGKNKVAMCIIPKGTKVNNYGYFTIVDGAKWLYIQFVLNGVKYTGFSHSRYFENDEEDS